MRVYLVSSLVLLLTLVSSTLADQDAHTLRIVHSISDGFSVTTVSESGTDYTMITNAYAQVIVERPSTYPPLQTSTWTSGGNAYLEMSFGGELGYGCGIGYCRFIDIYTKSCVPAPCDDGCMICYGKPTVVTDTLEFGPGPF